MEDTLDKIALRSEEVQEILSNPPNWMIRWGNALFLVLILLVLFFSWLVKYPDIIDAEAIITSKVPPQKEFAKITAKFDSIYVKESQDVRANTVLAVLENNANSEDVFYLKSLIDTLVTPSYTFQFPMEKLPILFLGDIDQSFAVFENNYYNYQLNASLQPFTDQSMANKTALTEVQGRLFGLQKQYEIGQAEYRLVKANLERHKILFEKGVISRQEYENKQVEALTSERNNNNLRVAISQTREAIASATNTVKGTQFSRSREETQLLKSTLQSYNQLKRAIRDWENTYVLKAKIGGKVSFLNYWNKNQTVHQGDLVFTILPGNNSDYLAKLKVPIYNSGKVEIGQNVNVKLQNYPESEFGHLQGRVHGISLTPDAEGYYVVDVSLPKELITSYGEEIEFKQEMKGKAEIITEDLRLLDRFMYQFRQIFY